MFTNIIYVIGTPVAPTTSIVSSHNLFKSSLRKTYHARVCSRPTHRRRHEPNVLLQHESIFLALNLSDTIYLLSPVTDGRKMSRCI